jgi:hypothetical protein
LKGEGLKNIRKMVFLGIVILLLYNPVGHLENLREMMEGLEREKLESKIAKKVSGLLKEIATPPTTVINYSLIFFEPFLIGHVDIETIPIETHPERLIEKALEISSMRRVIVVADNMDMRRSPTLSRTHVLKRLSEPPFSLYWKRRFPIIMDEKRRIPFEIGIFVREREK